MKKQQLSAASLSKLKSSVDVPSYERSSITSGIVHFGTGNFHRAHQAMYCDTLLNQGESCWGITGVSLRSAAMRDKLEPQDFLYTLATLGETTSYRIIGALQNLLVAPENPAAVIDTVANDKTILVTITITEKGYCLAGGVIDKNHADIAQEFKSLARPQTIYGYLAAAIIKRCANQGGPLTILCCDNMHAGGEHLYNGVTMLLEHHSPETLAWVKKNSIFSSSMVDRVTPVTDKILIDSVANELGIEDAAPVATEAFTQWIIEDRFAGTRPPFDRAGALFVKDIAPYEKIKLRFLNAGHSMLATLGYLAGDRFIHEALQRPSLARFTEQALKLSVMPVTSVPAGINAASYINDVLERFRNNHLPYGVLQVGTDSSQKIQQRWLPTIDDILRQKQDTSYLAFALAAWVCFIQKAIMNNDLSDPQSNKFSAFIAAGNGNIVEEFLALAGAEKFGFVSDNSFMESVNKFYRSINETGAEQAIDCYFS
jgi:fructuronate reductase